MPTTVVNSPDGRLIDVNHPDGATDEQILSYAAQQYALDPSIAYESPDVDTTTVLGGLAEMGKRAVGGFGTGTVSTLTGIGQILPGVSDRAMVEADIAFREATAEALGYDPAYDETDYAMFGEGAGEMLPMVASYLIPGSAPVQALRAATLAGPSLAQGGMDRYTEEQERGEALTSVERLGSKSADLVLGAAEKFGLPQRILKGLPRGFFQTSEGRPILKRMESAIITGVGEGTQETLTGIARDLSTRAIFDPDREIADSALQDFKLGTGLGAFYDLVLSSFSGRRPKAKAPSEMEELTEEEIGQEQERREKTARDEAARRREMDDVVSAGTGERFTGPTMPDEVRRDPLDTTQLDPNRDLEAIADDIIRMSGSRLPVDARFNVKTEGRKNFVEQNGEQFGPAFDDPLSAQELANRLTGTSQQLRKTAEVDYIVDNAGLEYDNIQSDEAKQLGRAVLSDSERVISVADANLATGRDIGSAINRSRVKQKENEILKNEKRKATTDEIASVQSDFVSLKEIRAANKGDIGRLGDVIAEKDADFLAFRDDPRPAESPTSPTRPRQPALGRRQQALKTFSSSFENAISSERAFKELLARKRMDVDVKSNEFRGLIKKVLGKTPPKKDPLASLSPNDRRYLYHRIRRLPSFQSQATKIPDFSVKTPDAETVRRARRQVEVDADPADVIAQRATSRAEARRVEDEARRTAGPRIDRAEQGVEQGMEVAEYDIEKSGLAQQLKDMLNKFGVSDEVSVRLVEKLGRARRDSDGNIYILGRDPREIDDDAQEYGVFSAGARVIQVGLEGVRDRVKDGATYEEAVARAMNHEIVHALRRMDLFTKEEYSLLERLSRKYEKPGEGMTYGQWATKNYEGLDAIRQQEEAIAEMISDALTDGVVIDNKVKKPSGKPAAIFKKIVDFFKDLVGIAEKADTDIDSFKALVDEIQGGRVGRRERGVVRTALQRDYDAGQDIERGITTADLATRTGDRRPYVLRDVVERVKREAPKAQQGQRMGDAPEVDDEMLSRRIKRAADQDYDVNTIYYHGSEDPNIKKFRARVGMGVVAGHFTTDKSLANIFAPDKITLGGRKIPSTMYPVFLRNFNEDNNSPMMGRRSLYAHADEGADSANQLMLEIMDRDLSELPDLEADLVSFFERQLDTFASTKPGVAADAKLFGQKAQDLGRAYLTETKQDVLGGDPSIDIAPIRKKYARKLAEVFHKEDAPRALKRADEDPYDIDFTDLERLAPYIKEAGFAGYRDVEQAGTSYSAVAIFDPADVKGAFAQFDPSSVPDGKRYEDDIMYSRRSAVDMFEQKAFDHIGASGRENLIPGRINPAHKARHTIVDMPIDMFLGLARVGESNVKTKGVEDLVKRGVKFDELPQLHTRPVNSEDYGPILIVHGHEGRHRARALKAAGYTTMPVRIFDSTIRWGEQNSPKSFDYLDYWPQKVIAEADINRKTDPTKAGYQPTGLYTYPMFINRDGTVDFKPPIDRPSVIFEVAPDPRNKELSANWNSLDEATRLEVSEKVARSLVPYALAEVGASGTIVSQIGSYYNDTNPSFAVRLTSGDPTDAAAAVGFVLQQESMMIVSPRPYEGADSQFDPRLEQETRSIPAVFIKIGDKPLAEVDRIYQKLRAVEGVPEFSGQTTIDGTMMILFGADADADAVVDAFDSALDSVYPIDSTVLFSSFPESKDYDYETKVPDTRISRSDARERLISLRSQAEREIARITRRIQGEPLDAGSGRADAPAYERTVRGALNEEGKLELSHFSSKSISILDPTLAGTGADRSKRIRPTIGSWLGLTTAEESPYIKEPVVGNVENKFEVDPSRLYVISDHENPSAPQDPQNVFTTADGTPFTYLDFDAITDKVRDLGFDGYLINAPALGKVVVMHVPLQKPIGDFFEEGKPQTKDIQTEKIAPRQSIDPAQAEQAVADNLKAIEDNPQSVPLFSAKASPDAQYIAKNPDAGLKPPRDDEFFSKKKDSAAVDKLTRGPDREAPNFKIFMDATDLGDIRTFLTRLKAGAINRYAALEKYYQNIPGLRELEADSSAIAAALFADKSKAILASAIKYGVPVYKDGITKVEDFTHTSRKYKRLNGTYRGLIGVMSLIHNKEDGDLRKLAQAYAMVQRGKYLDKRGKLSPVDPKTRREILAEVDALTQSDGYNPIKGWHEVWMAYNDKTIDFLRDTGILNEKTADVWRDSSYIPFYRTGEKDNLPKNAKNVFGDLSRMAEFVAYRGSEKAVDVGLVESVTMNLNAAIDMGMKNVAQQRIVRDMQNLGLARQVPVSTPDKNGNFVTFKINGNKVKFEIDDNLIHDSLLSSGGVGFAMAEKYLGMPASFLREMVTRDPGFMFANMLRDTLSTWATSGADFTPFKDTFGRFNDDLERLEKLGVVGGYDFAIDRADIGKFYEDETRRRGISGDPINMFVNLWNVAGQFTTKSDAATRQAVYDDVLARTGNEAEAAFQAMEIINFSRRGSNPYVKLVTATIPFLNARFQGLDVFMRSLGGDYSAVREEQKSKIQLRLAIRASTMVGFTALYYALASGNDWYEEQDEEVRELNWLIPTPWGVPFKIPIPFEVGLLFKTLPEAILANYAGRQSDRETRETLQRGLVSTLEVNPLGFQIIAPFAEAALNRSAFTGRPVVPIYMSQITPGLQTTVNTPEFIADVGEVLNISPMKIDHVVRGYTGTLGSYAVSLTDSLYRATIDGALGDDVGFAGARPSKNIFEFPLWRRFFGKREGGGLRADVYDMYYDIQEVVRTMSELEDAGRINELRAYIASRSAVLALQNDVYYLRNRMTRARQEKEQILAADIDPKEKQKLMEQIDASINDELKAVVPELKRLRDAPAFQSTY